MSMAWRRTQEGRCVRYSIVRDFRDAFLVQMRELELRRLLSVMGGVCPMSTRETWKIQSEPMDTRDGHRT